MAKGLLDQAPHQVGNWQERALQAEEARRIAEARYRWLFDRNLAGVYLAALDGRILDLNVACSQMFGYRSPAEARTHRLQETVPSLGDLKLFVNNLRKRKFINDVETQLRRPDGQLLWVRLNASLIESDQEPREVIEGTLIDITEWKHAEEELRLSETRFKNLVERSSDAISLVDASGNVLYSSHAVSPIFGYQLEERVGKSVFELIHRGDIQEILPLFKKLVQSPFSSVTTQVRYRHKNGSWRWIEALGTNLLEDPSVKAVVINYRDVTERMQLQEQLYQAQKMEAVGRLAGGVAHDFNNLLTAILGYSDMLLEKLPQASALRRYTGEIKKAGERAASLTRQLLAFSRLQVLSPQVLDLNAVISEMENILRRVIGEDVRLATLPGGALGRVKADPAQIEQVIINLAVNARDAMPEGGELAIKTSNIEIEEG
ncbi:MAG TPA: PAS domain S-box protein, partial [Terriglobia bacterium]|nr:PAS domain S-box protein [Terriglobia bacterium]